MGAIRPIQFNHSYHHRKGQRERRKPANFTIGAASGFKPPAVHVSQAFIRRTQSKCKGTCLKNLSMSTHPTELELFHSMRHPESNS